MPGVQSRGDVDKRLARSRSQAKMKMCWPFTANKARCLGILLLLLHLMFTIEWNISFHLRVIADPSAYTVFFFPAKSVNTSTPMLDSRVSTIPNHRTINIDSSADAGLGPPINHQLESEPISGIPVKQNDPLHRPLGARVLLGIFSKYDSFRFQQEYRAIVQHWKSDAHYGPAICPLSEFLMLPNEDSRCELIYTFVVGAGDVEAPTQVSSSERPMLSNRSAMPEGWFGFNDTTLLNIRENANEGKAQTWLRYASQVAQNYGIEYVAKCEHTSSLDIPKYFRFADRRLLPAPYNKGLFAGSMRDKHFWKQSLKGEVKEVRLTDKHFWWIHRARFYMESK
jgi:hypothetical protein